MRLFQENEEYYNQEAAHIFDFDKNFSLGQYETNKYWGKGDN